LGAGEAAEVGLGAADIAEDLGFELFGGVEFALVAEAVEEADFDPGGRRGVGSREWGSERVEQMGFDAERAFDEGGAVADVGDGGERRCRVSGIGCQVSGVRWSGKHRARLGVVVNP
jgi:hypothetical protein